MIDIAINKSRFAHFFIDPLFNENSTLSEVNAVNSGNVLNIALPLIKN